MSWTYPQPATEEAASMAPQAKPSANRKAGEGLKVLIVDD